MKVCLVEDMTWGGISAQHIEDRHDHDEPIKGYVRVSEIVEIDFQMLTTPDVVARQVAILDEQERVVHLAAQEKILEIQRKKSELLAIGHDGGEK